MRIVQVTSIQRCGAQLMEWPDSTPVMHLESFGRSASQRFPWGDRLSLKTLPNLYPSWQALAAIMSPGKRCLSTVVVSSTSEACSFLISPQENRVLHLMAFASEELRRRDSLVSVIRFAEKVFGERQLGLELH